MAIPVLIIGKSGAGKSTSLRNCVNNDNWNVIKVLDKPFPFKGNINHWITDDYQTVMKYLFASKAGNIVIDDAGYLITNQFMKGHSNCGQGNAIFQFYNDIGDSFWNLIRFVTEKVQKHKIVYFIMHEDQNDFGDVKAKTIGKLLDDKVCIEGMFTIVLRCIEQSGKHLFVTQSADGAISKSPMGMFDSLTAEGQITIDNDILFVEKAIREYYDLPLTITKSEQDKKEEEGNGKTAGV